MTNNAIAWNKMKEEQRHNQATEELQKMGIALQGAGLAETQRANTAREALTAAQNAISQFQAETAAKNAAVQREKMQFDMDHYWYSTILGNKQLTGMAVSGAGTLLDTIFPIAAGLL